MSEHESNSPNDEWREVVMERTDLNDWPHFELPPGFAIRAYQPGDAEIWTQIQRRADTLNVFSPETFRAAFGTDETILAVRQKYLLGPGGEPVGTATAWFDVPQSGEEIGAGRVHWVAIVPEFQGRGLAKPLLDSVLQMLRVCGHTRAVLLTDTRRPAAIALYEKFGFRGV